MTTTAHSTVCRGWGCVECVTYNTRVKINKGGKEMTEHHDEPTYVIPPCPSECTCKSEDADCDNCGISGCYTCDQRSQQKWCCWCGKSGCFECVKFNIRGNMSLHFCKECTKVQENIEDMQDELLTHNEPTTPPLKCVFDKACGNCRWCKAAQPKKKKRTPVC
jgi:hypothetical protein